MVEIFGNGDVNRKINAVAATSNEFHRPERRLDAFRALAFVFLETILFKYELSLDNVNFFGIFKLTLPIGGRVDRPLDRPPSDPSVRD